MKKIWSLVLVATLMAAMFAGCGKKNSGKDNNAATTPTVAPTAGEATTAPTEPAATTAAMDKVNVAYMPNYASLAEVESGINMGYFKEQGIDVTLTEFADGPTIIAAMESGSIDIGYIGPGAHKLCIQGRAKIFATAHLGSADEVIGNKKKGISTVADLKGKTVAMASGTSSEQILDLTLAQAGLTKKDVKVMDMDASAIATAMISGSIDACATWSPNTLAIKDALGDNAVSLGNAMMFMDKSPAIASWIINPSYADSHADLILRFTKALYKSKDYRAQEANYEQISKWVAKQVGLDYETVYSQREDASWITSEELVNMINDGTLEKYYKVQQDNFIAAGAVTDEVPVSDYVMFQNMLDAAK